MVSCKLLNREAKIRFLWLISEYDFVASVIIDVKNLTLQHYISLRMSFFDSVGVLLCCFMADN